MKHTNTNNSESTYPTFQYIPYPKAFDILNSRYNATKEEIAAWVWFGGDNNGLSAFLNANELKEPQRFFYSNNDDDFDYIKPLMACWFVEKDIFQFTPTDRFITGKSLLKRWAEIKSIDTQAYIQAKVAETQLFDVHPINGITQASEPGNESIPSLESALFLISHIEKIEVEELNGSLSGKAKNPVNRNITIKPDSSARRIEIAKHAANARHNRPGGSRDKQRKIREAWASGKYTTKDRCAEEECGALNMAFSTARKALKNIPKPTTT